MGEVGSSKSIGVSVVTSHSRLGRARDLSTDFVPLLETVNAWVEAAGGGRAGRHDGKGGDRRRRNGWKAGDRFME